MFRQKRNAFTLIELLVVITIIGMLMSLLLPALANMKERGRQMTCSNNIRNLGQAMASFESKKQRYPGYLNLIKKNDNKTVWTTPGAGDQKQGASWAIMLMPFLELDITYNTLRSSGTTSSTQGVTRVDLFICPSNPPTTMGGAYLGYVANGGGIDSTSPATATIPRDWADNGVFFDRYSDDSANGIAAPGLNIVEMSSAKIIDGTGNTLMLAENVDTEMYTDYIEETLAFTWDALTTNPVDLTSDPPTVNPTGHARRINQDIGGRAVEIAEASEYTPPADGINTTTGLQEHARPSSYHRDGVNVVYCDSHTAFLSQDIDYYVYCLLMTSHGAGARVPGAATPIPHYDRPLNETWIKK